MSAACHFVSHFVMNDPQSASVSIELFGSLALTGKGHGIERALIAGLHANNPDHIEPEEIDKLCNQVADTDQVITHNMTLQFNPQSDIHYHYDKQLAYHPNAMIFNLFDKNQELICTRTYYSVGGGFVNDQDLNCLQDSQGSSYNSTEAIRQFCENNDLSLYTYLRMKEIDIDPRGDLEKKIAQIWQEMRDCIQRGCETQGLLPGPLGVKRRAMDLKERVLNQDNPSLFDDSIWLSIYAMAVNEENACGQRVVTAPTNGASGVLPAVLAYAEKFYASHLAEDYLMRFFLIAGFIGTLCQQRASISGAEVGCQGEVGVACAMAAGGLVSALGGQDWQIEKAAEMALEHHLGLTCDPIKGLVQIPCIERNAMGATKAYNIATICMIEQDHQNLINLDTVIDTMYQTGLDMCGSYKETSKGGLAKTYTAC